MPTFDPTTGKRLTGFALLPAAKRRQIAASGGRAVPAHLRGFAQDRALARAAGAKGGAAGAGIPKPRGERP